jgi:hypothetical protein
MQENSDARKAAAARHLKRGRYESAFREYLSLAQEGDAAAQVMLGWLHQNGHGTARDLDVALEWYRRAAKGGAAEGLFYTARLLEALGQPDDAVGYLRTAASRGYSPALARLGAMHLYGRGAELKRSLAVDYLSNAARQGNFFARRELSLLAWRESASMVGRVRGALGLTAAVVGGMICGLLRPDSDRIRS